jgi:hypothetical protein
MKEMPEVVATFLKGSVFCSIGAIIFVGEVSGFFCSSKTKALAGDDVNVELCAVWLNREVAGADVIEPKNPKPVFAALAFGTAGETLFGIDSETSLGKYGLLATAAWVVVSVRTGSVCVFDATLVSTVVVISLRSLVADTGGQILGKVTVAVAVEAITSLVDGDGFLMKSSVEKPRMAQSVS